MAHQLPKQLGRYTLIQRLGQGGMGSVYLAEDSQLGRRVALKIPDFGSDGGQDARRRFLDEARTAATLDHPYLCPVFDAGEIDGHLYLSMAYIEGQSLAALIGDEGWAQHKVAALVGKLALAMQEAHTRKVVHRDLKPANVMIKTTGRRHEPVIVDFGLAHRDNPKEQRLTKSGQIMGTLGYMAPEQIRGDLQEIGPACDIYALGVILYELLTGRLPFSGSALAVAGQILTKAPLPPSSHRNEIDPTLETICLRAMAKTVADRYASMGELAAALRGFLRSAAAASAPMPPVRQSDSATPASDQSPHSPGSDTLVGQFLAELAENDRPLVPIPVSEPAASRTPLPERRRPPRSMIAGAVAFSAVLLGVIAYVATDKGTIRIEVENPKNVVVVKVDGKDASIKALDEPITLRPGEHEVEVRWGDRTFRTARFAVVRGDGNRAVQIIDPAPEVPAPAIMDGPPNPSTVESPTRPETSAVPSLESLGRLPPEQGGTAGMEVSEVRSGPRSAGIDATPTRPSADEPPVPAATNPTPPREPASSPAFGTTGTNGEFQPLFNGKDLTGWKTHPKQPGRWHVANSVLVGSGPAPSHLYTERDDFQDFQLHIEARFNKDGSGGVSFRCPFGPRLPQDNPRWPEGYEATINSARPVRKNTGGFYPGSGDSVWITEFVRVPFGQWFTMDIFADGSAFSIVVNGEPSGYRAGVKPFFPRGHIALQQFGPGTVIEFRKIAVKELNRPDQKDPKEIKRFSTGGRVNRAAFSPDGQFVFAGVMHLSHWAVPGYHWFRGEGVTIRSWDVASGRDVFRAGNGPSVVRSFALSSNGRFAAACGPRSLIICDLENKKISHRFAIKEKQSDLQYLAVSFAPDDRRVLAVTSSGNVSAWDVATGQEQPPYTLAAGVVPFHEFQAAMFGSDRRHLVTGRRAGLVELWDLQRGKRVKTFTGHTGGVRRVAYSADGRLILSDGSDNTVRLWDVSHAKQRKQLTSHDRPVWCIALSPDGRRILYGDAYGSVHLCDVESGKEVCRMEGHTMGVTCVDFSPDGARALSSSDDQTVRLWQLPELGVAPGARSITAGISPRETVVKPPVPPPATNPGIGADSAASPK